MVILSSGLFFQLFLQFVFVLFICRGRPDVWLVYWVSVAFSFLVALTYYFQYSNPFFIGGSDDLTYIMHAHELVAYSWPYSIDEVAGIFSHYDSHNSIGYVVFVASLMEVFGTSPLTPIVFNCFLHTLIYFFMSRFLWKNFSVPKYLVFFTIGVNFYILYWGVAHVFREALVATLIFSFFYIFVVRKMRVIRLTIAGFLLYFLSFVRAPLVPILLGIGASKFIGRFKVLFYFLSSPRGLVFLILSSLLFFGVSYYLGGPVGHYQISYDSYRSSLAPGLAQYIFASPQIVRPLLKFLSSLGYPFPSFSSWYDFLVSIQIPINLFFYFYFFRGVKAFSLTDFRVLSLLAVVFALMFSVLTYNPRQYIIVVYLAMPICLVGFVSSFRKSEAVVVLLPIVSVFSLFLLYYIYRL